MRKTIIVIVLLIGILLAGCAAPAPQATVQTGIDTAVPAPTEANDSGPVVEATAPVSPEQPVETEAAPEATAASTAEPPGGPSGYIAYTGADANLWLVDRLSGERRQLTQDAASWQNNQQGTAPVINYFSPRWSSDGRLLAYIREQGLPIDSGYEFSYALLVYDMQSQGSRSLLEDEQFGGFAWKPGENLITYALPPDVEYFIRQGQNTELALGIWALEVDTGSRYELVPPQRGFTLMQPRWSPDGRFLSFEEVYLMEGSGNFAYFDVEAQEYVAWDRPIGLYSWSPDGETISYDYLTYIPIGSEFIHLNDRHGSAERPLSPDYDPGYAFNPVFSPQGDMLAYLAQEDSLPESTRYTVYVIELPDGEPRSLGEFEQVREMSWSPDGGRLIFTAGPFEQQQVLEILVSDGSVNSLAQGGQPAWQPAVP